MTSAVWELEFDTIKNALDCLTAETLQRVITDIGLQADDKESLRTLYEQQILVTGLSCITTPLSEKHLEEICQQIGISEGNEEELKKRLATFGLEILNCTSLQHLCNVNALCLIDFEDDALRKQVGDHIMYCGIARFLIRLSIGSLQSHCNDMELTVTGSKNSLIER